MSFKKSNQVKLFFHRIIFNYFFILIFIFLKVSISFAQTPEISQLKLKVKDYQKTNAQVDILNQLNKLLIQAKNQIEAEKYAEKAQKLAAQLNYQEGLAVAYENLGNLQALIQNRPDKASKSHEKAYRIFVKLYENKTLDKWKLYNFLTESAIPAYQFAVDADSKKRKYRKAIQNYEKLNAEFTKYLTSLAKENKENLKKNEEDLSKTNTQLNKTKSQLDQKKFSERNLLLDKLKISGKLEKKEMEALALSDSLLKKELELQNEALKSLEEKAKRETLEKNKILQDAEIQKQQNRNFTLILGLGLGFVLLVVIVFSLISQRKANKLLTRQRNELALMNQEIQLQKESIQAQNAELQQQKEEIEAQRDNIEIQHASLQQQTEEIEAQRDMLTELNEEIINQRDKSEELLLNILPQEIAQELKETGKAKPHHYEMVTVLFTDFKGFTKIAEQLRPEEIINELEYCFSAFDEIIAKYDMEKIKTIGDAYMCAGGLPIPNKTNPIDAVKAGLAMQDFMEKYKQEKIARNQPIWELRLGIHTGPLVAGVIGKNKFAYDIWGDTVNFASRMESAGEAGKVNISGVTYELVKSYFRCTYRGKVYAKNKGDIDMYFVESKSSLFQSLQNLKG